MRNYLRLALGLMFLWGSVAIADNVPDEIIIKFKPVQSSQTISFEKINQLNDLPLSYRAILTALEVKELKPLYKQKTAVMLEKLNKKIFTQSLKPDLTKLDLKRLNRMQRYLERKQQVGDDRAYVIKLNANADIDQVMKQLLLQPEVESVQKNILYQTFVTPNDPLFTSNQNNAPNQVFKKMGLPMAWEITTGNGTVIVAVIDTGFKVDHPELLGQFWVNPGETLDGLDNDGNGKIDDINGWNFIDNDNLLLNTGSEHGTNVASIVAASSNNLIAMTGVNWNAKIMGLKVFSTTGNSSTLYITNAIDYAMANGADVINMSLGGTGNDPALETKCQQAYDAGIVLVASMGNYPSTGINSADTLVYPAAYPTVIGVGSVSSNTLAPSNFSVRGIFPFTTELVAIGEDMCVARNNNAVICTGDGTSFSAPVVAGVASLLLSKEPSLTPLQLRIRLQNTATDVYTPGKDTSTGYGLVNAYNALNATPSTINVPTNSLDSLRHFPNPTPGPRITFIYQLNETATEVKIRIFDLRGRMLLEKSLGSGVVGKNSYVFDLMINNQKLAVGTYVYQIEATIGGNKIRQIERFSVI